MENVAIWRYIIGFLIAAVLGAIINYHVPGWMHVLAVLGILVIFELAGKLVQREEWPKLRLYIHLDYSVVAVPVSIGYMSGVWGRDTILMGPGQSLINLFF